MSTKQRNKGKFSYKGGDYDGEFIGNRLPHGTGTLKYPNGDNYTGEFKMGQCHGKGILTSSDGNVYKGDFLFDIMNGSGLLTLNNKETFEGSFVDGLFQGNGKYTWTPTHYYQGNWLAGKRSGQGILVFETNKYEGSWKNDVRHGRGIETTKSAKFEGFWFEGKKHGMGYFDLKKKTQGFSIQTWEMGSIKEESLQDVAPILTPPTEIAYLTEEKEAEFLKEFPVTSDDQDLAKYVAEALISKRIASWNTVIHLFPEYFTIKSSLEIIQVKIKRIQDIQSDTCDKSMLEERIKFLDSVQQDKMKLLEAFERYGFRTSELNQDSQMEAIVLKYQSIMQEFRSDLIKMNQLIEEGKKIGDLNALKSREEDLEKKFDQIKYKHDENIKLLETALSNSVDKHVSVYLEMFKNVESFVVKLLTIKKKHIKVYPDPNNKELITTIQGLYEKNLSNYEQVMSTNSINYVKCNVEVSLLIQRAYQLSDHISQE